MGSERQFIEENVKTVSVKKYVEGELATLGCGKVAVYRTPLGMRISVTAEKPGLIIGNRGKSIQELTNTLKTKFSLENPQIEVNQEEIPELNPQIVGQWIAGAIERGMHFRRVAYSAIKKVMGSGAQGIEIRVAGKISGERAKSEKFRAGAIMHSGALKEKTVLEATVQSKPKIGIMGIRVRIVPPNATVSSITFKPQEKKEEPPAEQPKEEAEKPEEKKPKEKTKEQIEKLEEKILETIDKRETV